jgi:TolA-binding protein
MRRVAQLELLFNEYKDTLVASGIKIKDTSKWTDPKRILASVVSDPAFKYVPHIQPGSKELTIAKRVFASDGFGRAGELLDEFIKNYPDHPGLPEAGYLLAESQYHVGNLEASARAIDFVVSHFPETEFAGYSLLRLGKIFESQERPEEAAQMYHLVLNHYDKSNSASLAAKNLKELDL